MRYLVFILMLASFAYSQALPPIEPGVSHELAIWRAGNYSDIRYKLNLTLEKMSPVLKGSIEIRVNVSEPGAIATGSLPPIILDWRKIRGSESLSTISNVSVNGNPVKNPVAIAPGSDTEHLIFRNGVVAGENVIKLDFTSPILTSGSAITRYVDKEDGAEYIYSLFVPSDASTAFPVFDQPDLKARFQLKLVYPDSWNVVSNTPGKQHILLQEPISDTVIKVAGEKDTEFEETKPISTYVFAFAAGPFHQFSYRSGENYRNSDDTFLTRPVDPNGFFMNVFVRKSQAEKFRPHAAEVFRLTREGVKYLETYFDYKFPFPKYDLVLIPEFPFGGMEHAGATFLREDRIIFPQEPTKNDYITRANVIFHETAHQWFGDTVTMKWFDDLWLKEGFAEFMAYKTMEKVMPEYNAWKVFYERNKQAAYLTDSTKGTTPIYQPIANLSAAKSAYGNIVYRKAPSFLRQAEFYLRPDKFQTAVRAFLKKHEFANATWEDLVKEYEAASGRDLKEWGDNWVKKPGLSLFTYKLLEKTSDQGTWEAMSVSAEDVAGRRIERRMDVLAITANSSGRAYPPVRVELSGRTNRLLYEAVGSPKSATNLYYFPNFGDYGYGIFLLDDKSRDYVLKNIENEKDDFLRSMMWGSLWDSVREGELDPKEYVELVIKNLGNTDKSGKSETDETTIATLLSRVTTAVNYYLADSQRADISTRLEALLLDKLQHASTPGERITYYRTYVNIASTPKSHEVLKQMLASIISPAVKQGPPAIPRTKDKFDIVTRLAILGDPDAPRLLAGLEKTETSGDAKRYAYAAHAAFATAEVKAKYWNDLLHNKDISESWAEAAIVPFNSIRHADLTARYLERALAELPNLKRTRKIFFINNWLAAFIGGQRSEAALAVINKFLADNPDLDNDLRLKILENSDLIERSVKIRAKYAK